MFRPQLADLLRSWSTSGATDKAVCVTHALWGNRCDRRGRVTTARLVAQHGAGMPVRELLRIIAAGRPRIQAVAFHDVSVVHSHWVGAVASQSKGAGSAV